MSPLQVTRAIVYLMISLLVIMVAAYAFGDKKIFQDMFGLWIAASIPSALYAAWALFICENPEEVRPARLDEDGRCERRY